MDYTDYNQLHLQTYQALKFLLENKIKCKDSDLQHGIGPQETSLKNIKKNVQSIKKRENVIHFQIKSPDLQTVHHEVRYIIYKKVLDYVSRFFFHQ